MIYVIMQHVKNCPSRPLTALKDDLEKAQRWANAIRGGSTQIPGVNNMLATYDDNIEVVAIEEH